ncbi:MAG TPA: GNAT family N-acetyltransferase [Ktedonobacterales bacterium]|jgi:RimJ/RimL family protein N-acetyltransferase|nr:GNAT family N-acetyltransferase [Ktedonobacterales bacterium]
MTSRLIVGEGLVLRRWTTADLEAMVALFDEANIARWTPLQSPFDATAATAYVERACSLAATRLQLAITVDGDEPLGEVMLDVPTAVAGYMVGARFRRQGLASRALRVITAYAHGVARLGAVNLHVATANSASAEVARRAGYTLSEAPLERVQNKGEWQVLGTWVHRSGEL